MIPPLTPTGWLIVGWLIVLVFWESAVIYRQLRRKRLRR